MIAIHNSGQWSFRPEWEDYCKRKNIPYKLVNAYNTDIIDQVRDCSYFLFHHHHTSARDIIFAKNLLYALEQSGKRVFPNFSTGWYFDDKLGQKYLLESIDAPIAHSHIFYDREEALNFMRQTSYPKVFKLRGGAGSNNVALIKDRSEAELFINRCFGRGFSNYNRLGDIKEVWRRRKLGHASNYEMIKSIRRWVVGTAYEKIAGSERGYFLIQDFIPNNDHDIRVVTVGDRAFAIKRLVRKNDFRASGGGAILYDKELIDKRCVDIAFSVSDRLKAQTCAYDFVFDEHHNPLIIEINYGYAHRAYNACPGYYMRDGRFIEETIDPCGWII
jgi:glutathione synthase/RimK-type ligase-like ATP-grasp enzyme